MTDKPIQLPDWPGYTVTAQGRVYGRSGALLSHDKAGRVHLFKGKRVYSVYPAELLAEAFGHRTTDLTVDLARLKLENRKLKKLVATRERQRDALAAKILQSVGRKIRAKPIRNNEDEDDEDDEDREVTK